MVVVGESVVMASYRISQAVWLVCQVTKRPLTGEHVIDAGVVTNEVA